MSCAAKKVNIILNAMGQNIGQDFSNKLSLSEENKQVFVLYSKSIFL
jgi:hypothetical protein